MTCLIRIDPDQKEAISSMITGLGFEVTPTKQFEQNDTGEFEESNDAIACKRTFKDKDISTTVYLPAVLREIPGVRSVQPIYISDDERIEKGPWYRSSIIPISISSGITFITIVYAIEHLRTLLDPDHAIALDPWQLALVLGVPTAIVFLFQFLQKYFPGHQV